MRVIWSIGAVLLACSAAFPPAVVDGGRLGDGSATPDGGQGPDAEALGGPADAAPGTDGMRDAALVEPTPDARPVDAQPVDQAIPMASAALSVIEQRPVSGCIQRAVVLEWQTTEVDACTLRAVPGALEYEVPLVGLSMGSLEVEAIESTTYTLRCAGPLGEARAEASIVFEVALPPEQRLDGRDTVRAEQRRCARALGQQVVGGDGQVHDDGGSATRICRCAGYARADAWDGDRCFATPYDNTIATWRDGEWHVENAIVRNDCLNWVHCSAPAATCGDLLYPR